MQYRAAYDPDSYAFAQRLHYQRAWDSRFQWRVLAQSRKTSSSNVDFDFVQAELTWDITDASRDWQTGLRFDLRVRDRGRPATVGVNWTNQFMLSSGWQARLLAMTTLDIGSGSRDGIGLQTRANLYRGFGRGHQAGLELYSDYGTTSDFVGIDDQRHQLGPFSSLSFSNGWSVFAGALFGLTDATRDSDLRFWVTRRF